MHHRCPKEPVPEPLRGRELGTFTQISVAERLPEIGRRMVAENDFAPETRASIEQLLSEIPDGPIRQLGDRQAPDAAAWQRYITPYRGLDWLQPPWFFVENYFYRRIMEATGYFSFGRAGDPFLYQKRSGLSNRGQAVVELARQVAESRASGRLSRQALARLLNIALWGNQADLSMWPAGPDEAQLAHGDEDQQAAHTLVDDRARVVEMLLGSSGRPGRIDFLMDNAGFELLGDLVLMAALLQHDRAATIWLHTKPHPVFVSDVLNSDVWEAAGWLAAAQDETVATLGRQLQYYLNVGRMRLRPHFFWTSPLMGWEMPEPLREELGGAALIISKGDAHYRRLLGDRHWPYTAPFGDIVCYVPARLLALRTLKSEVAAGLQPGQAEAAAGRDPEWLVNGRWGILQFYEGE
jgi:uncharacterized protein with ATP-grasp and redox domains